MVAEQQDLAVVAAEQEGDEYSAMTRDELFIAARDLHKALDCERAKKRKWQQLCRRQSAAKDHIKKSSEVNRQSKKDCTLNSIGSEQN